MTRDQKNSGPALRAAAFSALVLGATAIGTMAIGWITIGKLRIFEGRLDRLPVQHLTAAELDVQPARSGQTA